MGSTEQAREPTMDEILASIRKIISDDEPGEDTSDAGARDAAAPVEGSAGAFDSAQPEAEEAEDILDLTQAIKPKVETPAVPQAAGDEAAGSGAPRGDALQAALEGAAQPEASAPPAAGAADHNAEIASLLAEAGVQDTAGESGPAGHEAAGPAQATEEEASITETLKAIDQAAEAEAVPPVADASMLEEADTAADFAMSAPAPEALTAAEMPDFSSAPDMGDDVLSDAVSALENSNFEAEQPVPEPAPEPVAAEAPAIEMPAPAQEPEMLPEPAEAEAAMDDHVSADRDGESQEPETPPLADVSSDSGSKSLEDSIKEMLRPMLRDWLDDNMERIVHDAVKDEVASGGLKEKN